MPRAPDECESGVQEAIDQWPKRSRRLELDSASLGGGAIDGVEDLGYDERLLGFDDRFVVIQDGVEPRILLLVSHLGPVVSHVRFDHWGDGSGEEFELLVISHLVEDDVAGMD